MAGIAAKFKSRAKKAVEWAGLNAEVGRDVFPDRHTYRPSPVSAPRPDFSLNFPVKTENVAEVRCVSTFVQSISTGAHGGFLYCSDTPKDKVGSKPKLSSLITRPSRQILN